MRSETTLRNEVHKPHLWGVSPGKQYRVGTIANALYAFWTHFRNLGLVPRRSLFLGGSLSAAGGSAYRTATVPPAYGPIYDSALRAT